MEGGGGVSFLWVTETPPLTIAGKKRRNGWVGGGGFKSALEVCLRGGGGVSKSVWGMELGHTPGPRLGPSQQPAAGRSQPAHCFFSAQAQRTVYLRKSRKSLRILHFITSEIAHHNWNYHFAWSHHFFHCEVIILSLAKVKGLQSRQKQGPKNASILQEHGSRHDRSDNMSLTTYYFECGSL